MTELTKEQARQFLLLRHGLLGEHRFRGKEGALAYIRQCGCIQFDPVDVCGRNAELVLQSRVKGFRMSHLSELLYRDRLLFDYPDKNQAIIPLEDRPYFARYRQRAAAAVPQFEGLQPLLEKAMAFIEANGPVSSAELPIEGEIFWHSSIHWSGNWHKPSNAARSVLEQLYSDGRLIIHHKEGTRKYYDLAARHLPEELRTAPDPLPEEQDHITWRILRRIRAVGLLWNRPSDAWLNIEAQQSAKLSKESRNAAFSSLLRDGKILEVRVEGIRDVLYCPAEDLPLLEEILSARKQKPRCELLAPLDCLLWDRKLLKAIFDFDYTWEIYTPEAKRKYGYYVLPMIYGDRFIGRVEAAADRKNGILTVKHLWTEPNITVTKTVQKAMERCLRRLAKLNGCEELILPE
ncbi:MAG: YcaQ family DNA glycosylase [Oscillospiraceae bacterium]|nr:YcaQ family DNA glycosylase [Oscillospiraceae bacterium]